MDGLQDFASKLAYGDASLKADNKKYSVVYNSDDKKKSALSDFYTFLDTILVVSEKTYEELGFCRFSLALRYLGHVKMTWHYTFSSYY